MPDEQTACRRVRSNAGLGPTCSLNKLATESKATNRRGRIFDVHARDRTTNDLRDGPSERRDLDLELRAGRRLTFEDSNENRHFRCVDRRFVFRILVRPERTKANPSLTGRRIERAADGVGKRLYEKLRRALRITDKLHRNDWHAVNVRVERPPLPTLGRSSACGRVRSNAGLGLLLLDSRFNGWPPALGPGNVAIGIGLEVRSDIAIGVEIQLAFVHRPRFPTSTRILSFGH